MLDSTTLSAEQLGRLLYKAAHEPRRNQKRYLKDLGGDGSADELDAVLAVAKETDAAVTEAKRLDRQREITAKTVAAGVDSAVIEMIGAIRVRMADTGTTQQELADACGWPQSQVAAYLTGKKMPGLENLTKMAAALNCRWRLVDA